MKIAQDPPVSCAHHSCNIHQPLGGENIYRIDGRGPIHEHVCEPDRLALHYFDQATSFGMHRYAMLEENATNGKAAGGLDFYRSFFFQYLDHRRDREAAMDGIVKD